ncbi:MULTISPECIES: DUF2845 domain-containing protein [Legionella]|uniref:DUF2845 domain-containing protein n=1 Tax=Legionella septentrionalis TaxID=2498109 RepID=A0A3S0WSY5_9GAMM|nr:MULTISPECIES: DUF2845 domain-containing protein [Legionella]MCP0914107.1 DUF2845 domain-containing protein [Legionella sp. 27cVA30]RUQ90735.1 DUF2845 domain-containing protein [Legionella septentrionalis]RUQ99959.1 DUF2845 domain-containing protein [Legionella septentrionalis]RUR10196.1 DUF2845 domain-containing protein [Legionella septentrionalis]RUR15792.1 DUF2845 domain-containing protein [Legionella septentrionalis]
MRLKHLGLLGIFLFPFDACAVQSLYCPQNQGYINVGMTEAEVIAACGEPLSKEESNRPVTQKVPVKQLIYSTVNKGSIYPSLDPIYNQWSLPSGTNINLEVDIINDKISEIRLNGSDTNAMTVCDGINVNVGDNESAVYNACGSPDMVNNTFINQPIPSNEPPHVWVYQVDQFQQPFTLTFVNGQLQSID